MNFRFALAAAALFAASGNAWADSCPSLVIEASLQMATDEKGLVVVPATLAGEIKPMILDTGGSISEVTQRTVSELGLKPFMNQFGAYNAAGNPSESAVGISPFALGNARATSYTFRVANMTALSTRQEQAGSIGVDVLQAYDIDLDFGGHKLNLISPNHCYGRVIYWKADAVAMVPLTPLPDGRVLVNVSVDGHPLKALLDTGSPQSTMSAEAARSLGVDQAYAGGAHSFNALALEGIAVSKPSIAIVRDLTDSSGRSIDSSTGASMTLGVDVLKHLHAYIAYKEQKLYLTAR
jgi:predicted aspartyl protease